MYCDSSELALVEITLGSMHAETVVHHGIAEMLCALERRGSAGALGAAETDIVFQQHDECTGRQATWRGLP